MKNKKALNTKAIVYIALCAALTAVLSQISIPLPSGVPITLQTFAIVFISFLLGWKYALASVLIYIGLGAAGMPVFANFTGGVGKLIGVTGGFIWGFIPLAVFAGAFALKRKATLSIPLGMFGLAICHVLGVTQFAAVSGGVWESAFLTVSAPYLLKDALSVVAAWMLAGVVGKRMGNRQSAEYRKLNGEEIDAENNI